ncbi:MAG: YdcF family protein [Sporomusaceae bacterium]|nr:YdcF family protein [Sporomusaceae bacterium]
MFYFIKFFYTTVLLPPGIFVLALLFLTLRLYQRQAPYRHYIAILTCCFYFATTPLVSGSVIRGLESQYIPPDNPRGDVIIMLGGGATFDTPNFTTQGHLSGYAANRLLTAVQLYEQLHVPIIVSGGRVFATTGREAEIARDILLRLGVPQNQIILENASINTTENALFTKDVLASRGFSAPILVTSAFHMPRSVSQFTKQGITVTPFPTDYLTNRQLHFDFRSLWPDADALSNLSLALKEYLGLLAVRWY